MRGPFPFLFPCPPLTRGFPCPRPLPLASWWGWLFCLPHILVKADRIPIVAWVDDCFSYFYLFGLNLNFDSLRNFEILPQLGYGAEVRFNFALFAAQFRDFISDQSYFLPFSPSLFLFGKFTVLSCSPKCFASDLAAGAFTAIPSELRHSPPFVSHWKVQLWRCATSKIEDSESRKSLIRENKIVTVEHKGQDDKKIY